MHMRPFGKLGFDVSAFGMGAMRLPKLSDGTIDYDEATRIIRRGIEGGVNYIDTAFVYHDGYSEVAVAKALAGGLRDRVRIATKLAVWREDAGTFEEQLDTSLRRLETDHIDFYLFHAVNEDSWNAHGEAVMKFMDDMVKKGKVLYPSFSFHDSPEVFRRIIDAYDWKMTQVQINFLDEDAKDQAALSGIRYAAAKGIPVVAMEPLRGGQLARVVPPSVESEYNAFPTRRSAVEWAFRYVYNMPEIVTTLSGVSDMTQMEDNLRIFAEAAPSSMSADEVALVHRVRDIYASRVKAGCTGCAYCMPCPSGVQIPDVLRAYDNAYVFENMDGFRKHYKGMEDKNNAQNACTECGLCEGQCPQHIHIIQQLKDAAAVAHA